ncbi:TolB family protein [Micromonospora ureilytica]|uniref:TolB family protein n=1 Tax=Micromonospora ureilytica TaxID=709868 RepID=UPI0040394F21
MNDQRLRLDLTALADEVTSVDLRDRTLRTSRRLGIQRAVATSAAALVLVAAAAGTAFAIRPDQSPSPLPADTPSVTATPTPSPTPTPSTSAGDTPGAPPSGGTGTNNPTVQFGKLFYGPADIAEAKTANLRSWRPGDSPVRLGALPEPSAMVKRVSISPDGRRVAWVQGDADGSLNLYTADVDGSDRQRMRTEVDELCVHPAWSPDGRHLLFREWNGTEGPGRYGVLDTGSANKTVRWWASEPAGCNPLWSSDGATIAMNTHDGVVLLDSSGNRERDMPVLDPKEFWASGEVVSLSPDGDRIALNRPDSTAKNLEDGVQAPSVVVVRDTQTGKEVELPLGGRKSRQVYFQTDGSMVVRVKAGSGYAVLLVDEDGRKISETAEPASLKDMQILAVVD